MKPRLLYLATRWPWPVSSGRMSMIDQTLRLAAETFEVHLCHVGKPGAAPAPANVASVSRLPAPGMASIAANIACGWRAAPLQDALFWSRAADAEFRAAVARVRPDVLVLDMLRTLQYAERSRDLLSGVRVVLDMDDRLSVRYRRMAALGASGVLGDFASRVPALVRGAAGVLPHALLGAEASRMHRREVSAPGLADHVLMVSASEASALALETGARNVAPFPPAIPFRPFRPRDFSRGVRAVFVGPDTYAPNAQALLELDRIADTVPGSAGVRFEHAGRSDAKLALRNVRQLGYVDDLESFLGADAVMVAPILAGTGVKTKLLEAMARGVPVLTTEVGAEGLSCGAAELAVAAPADLAGLVAGVCREERAMTEMGRRAHAYVRSAHSDDAARRALSAALGRELELREAA